MIRFSTIHIPSGSFRVSKRCNMLFQAHLGTCVGVGLFDHNAGVGGIIHILLPEPVSSFAPENPEKYGSTGLPMFISQMYSMGATAENIVATVAGGALVGPLSRQDINLDLGGRSTDIAINILCEEGIAIKKSETGGFFTCTLELNMSNGETDIRPAWNYNQKLTQEISTLKTLKSSPANILKPSRAFESAPPSKKEVELTIESLNPIPQTALKIMRIVQQTRYTLDDILNELKKDQVLAARTIQMCNAAMFAGKIKIETLKDALLILGEGTLISSVITAAIKNYFIQADTNGYSMCRGGMFFHSIGCAVTAEIIAKMTKSVDSKMAYTAGLIHDIGKVVLDQHIARRSPLFFREFHQNHADYILTEQRILGINHAEAGAMLADRWLFSDLLTDVVRYHHDPQNGSIKAKSRDIVNVVYIADLLMSRFHTTIETDKLQSENLNQILEAVGLSFSDIALIIDTIPLYIFELNSEA
ncbi:MAG: HDOD domain-containing protein [Desulfamplus sp.]|nr:HDOD domain-containing protein [Desulfamplus sp.]